MNLFGRSYVFFHPEFDKEAIYKCFMAYSRVFRGWGLILTEFRELSFCGPGGPCYVLIENLF